MAKTKTVNCRICKKSFKNKRALATHSRVHKNGKGKVTSELKYNLKRAGALYTEITGAKHPASSIKGNESTKRLASVILDLIYTLDHNQIYEREFPKHIAFLERARGGSLPSSVKPIVNIIGSTLTKYLPNLLGEVTENLTRLGTRKLQGAGISEDIRAAVGPSLRKFLPSLTGDLTRNLATFGIDKALGRGIRPADW